MERTKFKLRYLVAGFAFTVFGFNGAYSSVLNLINSDDSASYNEASDFSFSDNGEELDVSDKGNNRSNKNSDYSDYYSDYSDDPDDDYSEDSFNESEKKVDAMETLHKAILPKHEGYIRAIDYLGDYDEFTKRLFEKRSFFDNYKKSYWGIYSKVIEILEGQDRKKLDAFLKKGKAAKPITTKVHMYRLAAYETIPGNENDKDELPADMVLVRIAEQLNTLASKNSDFYLLKEEDGETYVARVSARTNPKKFYCEEIPDVTTELRDLYKKSKTQGQKVLFDSSEIFKDFEHFDRLYPLLLTIAESTGQGILLSTIRSGNFFQTRFFCDVIEIKKKDHPKNTSLHAWDAGNFSVRPLFLLNKKKISDQIVMEIMKNYFENNPLLSLQHSGLYSSDYESSDGIYLKKGKLSKGIIWFILDKTHKVLYIVTYGDPVTFSEKI